MNCHLPILDLCVLGGYVATVVFVGLYFAGKSNDTEQFTAAGRSLPGWAVGLSMFGSYISSISFLANPGAAFSGDWTKFTFTLATPIGIFFAVKYFVPFYRKSGEVSAYEHLENRFGPWARTYAVVCFLLSQVCRMGLITYLLALAVSPLLGLSAEYRWMLIVGTGLLMIFYTFLGGMNAVVWMGVIQSLILIVGPMVCMIVLLVQIPGGFGTLLRHGQDNHKFAFDMHFDLTRSTFWMILIFSITNHLQNFGVDQSYVQRYITARDDREARKSIWITGLLYMPTAAFFFLIGTGLFTLYSLRPELAPAGVDFKTQGDQMFPWFITHQLPMGMAGVVIAALFAASMDSNLNSMATLTLVDLYKRYFRPQAGEKESMRVLRGSTFAWGVIFIVFGLFINHIASDPSAGKTALDLGWMFASIFSGGVLGLFLLGIIARRATSAIAAVATTIGVLLILWMTFSPTRFWPDLLSSIRSPFHDNMTMVFSTAILLLSGWVITLLAGPRHPRRLPDTDFRG